MASLPTIEVIEAIKLAENPPSHKTRGNTFKTSPPERIKNKFK